MRLERTALQERAGGNMARALPQGRWWEKPKHIALQQQSPCKVESGLPSNGDADELQIVALVLSNEHGLK